MDHDVVASRVGGIHDQIEDSAPGCLVEPRYLAAFGEPVSAVLLDSHAAERIARSRAPRVRDVFLGPCHLGQYVDLLERVVVT